MAGALLQVVFLGFTPQPFILPFLYKIITPIVIILGLFLAAVL